MSAQVTAIFCILVIVAATTLAVMPTKATDGSVELYYDDGTAEMFIGFDFMPQKAVKFSIPSGWSTVKILEAEYYVRGFNSLTYEAKVHIYDANPGDTTPPEIIVSLSPDNLWSPNYQCMEVMATLTVLMIVIQIQQIPYPPLPAMDLMTV